MDEATGDLLKRWNLSQYTEKFAAVDIATMLLLPKAEICALFPKMGDRVRFEASLSMYRDDQNKASSSTYEISPGSINSSFLNEVLGDNEQLISQWSDQDQTLVLLPSSDLQLRGKEDATGGQSLDPGSRESSTAEVSTQNSVRVILEKSVEGRQVLNIGLETGALPASLRGRLCKLLMETLVTAENPVLLADAQLLSLSNDIGRLFPKESPPLYYAPYLPADAYQTKRNTSGWLVNARRARRAHLISLGLLEKPKSRSRSKSSGKTDAACSPGIDLQGLEEGDADKVETALQQLSSSSAGPWQEVSGLWRETVRARLRYLYYEKGTLQEYFNKYPILQSSNGWRLLSSDYDSLFPDKTRGIQELEASTGTIIEAAKKKHSTTKDRFLRQKITDTLAICDEANSETKVIAAILLLGCLLNITPARRSKNDWQASRAEMLDGFVTTIDTETDVQVMIEERRQKLQKLNLTLQPFIIWCRESSATFTVCDNVLYKFPSLPEAVDITFKIFHATGAKYPTERFNIWLIIQIAFYKVRTSYDRMSQSVKETLVTLGVSI